MALKAISVSYLNASFPLAGTLGFGFDLTNSLFGQLPTDFSPFKTIKGPDGVNFNATGGDLFFHLKSPNEGLLLEGLRNLTTTLAQQAPGVLSHYTRDFSFVYKEGRDLTGFIDGTKNPATLLERREATLITRDDRVNFALNGSFAFASKFIHNLDAFSSLSLGQQENAIGRRKNDSYEFPDKKDFAHILKSDQEVFGNVYRQSQPIIDGNNAGLFFIAYCKTTKILTSMLLSMSGADASGVSDKLMHFTTAVQNNYYFFPSLDALAKL